MRIDLDENEFAIYDYSDIVTNPDDKPLVELADLVKHFAKFKIIDRFIGKPDSEDYVFSCGSDIEIYRLKWDDLFYYRIDDNINKRVILLQNYKRDFEEKVQHIYNAIYDAIPNEFKLKNYQIHREYKGYTVYYAPDKHCVDHMFGNIDEENFRDKLQTKDITIKIGENEYTILTWYLEYYFVKFIAYSHKDVMEIINDILTTDYHKKIEVHV